MFFKRNDMTIEKAIEIITASESGISVSFCANGCGYIMTPQGYHCAKTMLFPFGANHPDDGKNYPPFAELAAKWDKIHASGRTFEWRHGVLCVSPYRPDGEQRVYIPFKDL